MEIYTSYFAYIKNIPKEYTLVSVSGSVPLGVNVDIQEKDLYPTWDILSEYKKDNNTKKFTSRFIPEILSKVNLKEKLNKWKEISGNDKFVLICYEKTGDFCHRNLIAKELNNLGYNVKEYKKSEEETSLSDF